MRARVKKAATESRVSAEAPTEPAPEPVWLAGMNPEQREAVLHDDGPAALMAVAGCGKTRVLVHRVARLVAEGRAAPRDVLCVTFSKKAQEEMDARLKALGVGAVRAATWHSLALQILKEDHTEWSTWTIDDKSQDRTVLKQVLGFKGMDWKGADASALMRLFSVCAATLADPGSDEATALAREHFRFDATRALEAYARWRAALEERALLTFDLMLVYLHRHLSDPEVRERWGARWRYVIQDESQDANLAQIAIGRQLAGGHRNYMLIGDPAQAIYGFRGTTPEYLLAFEKEWGAKVITMHRNYRCARKIISIANAIIAPAKVRLPMEMTAERDLDGEVRCIASEDFDGEAREFSDLAQNHVLDGGSYSDLTALFRTNAQSRALEEALLREGIPYVVVGGTSFYERKEVKDLLGYLRVAVGAGDLDAVRRSINAPFRFLGAAFVERVMREAERQGEVEDWAALVESVGQAAGLQQRQRASAAQWASIVRDLGRDAAAGKAPADLLHQLISTTQYIAWLEREEGQESIENSQGANIRELVRVAGSFTTVDDFLAYVNKTVEAARRQRRDGQAGGERVLLMSVHRSKGLEWPVVFVAGMIDGVLPHARGDAEEERRLAYVAATRARDLLVLSHVRSFATRAGIKAASPSPFLRDAGLV